MNESKSMTRARLASPGGFGVHGSAEDGPRHAEPVPRLRRRCAWMGCEQRACYVGCANGLGMMSGCELHVRRWVRDGYRGLAAPIDQTELRED